jgi:hypothetical protein
MGFYAHVVDVCCKVSDEQAASLFSVIESGSGEFSSHWGETNVSVARDVWRKYGKTGLTGGERQDSYWTNGSVFQEQPF